MAAKKLARTAAPRGCAQQAQCLADALSGSSRGFAVVASEVCNLAQRSANAAKEIKTLIGDSVEKVGVGSRLAQSMRETRPAASASAMLPRGSATPARGAAAQGCANGAEDTADQAGAVDPAATPHYRTAALPAPPPPPPPPANVTGKTGNSSSPSLRSQKTHKPEMTSCSRP